MNAQKGAEIAAKAATVTKNARKADLVAALNSVQMTVLANPAVTDEMLVGMGFSPRRGGSKPQPRVPVAVTGLSASLSKIGAVKLAWNRSGNGKNTMFVVEASDDGVNWTILRSTTRVSFAAEGFTPGLAAWFRVTATTSVASSAPSLPVSVYALAATRAFSKADLKIAA